MTPTENSSNENNMEKKMQATKPSSLASVANNREQRVPGTNLLGTGLETRGVHAWFGKKHVLSDVSLDFAAGTVTALIGPSGCGKSTYLRTLNRMHEFIPTAALAGEVLLDGQDIYAPGTDVTKIRLKVGMVFQKPNPFPKSIFDNIAYGPRVTGMKLNKTETADLVEHALSKAGLWAEVKDKLDQSGFALSGGQQQRLCIARAIATSPDILLMDEPCASLDPIATSLIEDLMLELVNDYTVVIVTHNMQQAARVSDRTAFFSAKIDDAGQRFGHLVEMDQTSKIFTNPSDSRTEDYISGRFG